MYEGDEINSFDGNGTFDRPGAIMSSSPDEQQNAEPVKAPKAPKTDSTKDFAAAQSLASNPNTPQFFGEAAMAANPYPTQRTRSPRTSMRKPLIIGGIAIGAIALIAIIILAISGVTGGGTKIESTKVAGEMNVGAIFDDSAPIPMRTSPITPYGYITQDGKKWITPKQYTYAEQFYGGYAKAKFDGKVVIIDREGKTVIEQPENVDVHYDIRENVWIVGTDIYNVEMEKANEDGSKAAYSGYGYAFVVPTKAEGDASSYTTGIPYLVKVENGEKVYSCEVAGCNISVTKGYTDNKIYLIMVSEGQGSKIIDPEANKVLYEISNNEFFAREFEGVYAQYTRKTSTLKKHVVINDGSAKAQDNRPEKISKVSVSNSDKYFIKGCNGKGYKIVDTDGGEVLGCSTAPRIYLSEIVYRRFEKDNKEVIVQYADDGYELYDLKEKKAFKKYSGITDFELYEDSPFVRIVKKDGKNYICNVLGSENDCIEYDGKLKVEPYVTYIVIDGKTYSHNLKEVKYVEK